MISVLYIDDEPALLEIGKLFLEKSGIMQVDTLDSPEQAVEKIRAKSYDAIISDYEMPLINGITLLQTIRQEFPELPFIIFTGRGREEIVIMALNSGADYYLQKGGELKPQFAELVHMIERSVERKRANDSIIRLNRIYSVLTSTNRAIIHIRKQEPLLQEACRIAVEEGKFLMAWIGLVDPNTREVLPVAACGYEEGYLDTISITIDESPKGRGLTGISVREGRTVVSNNIAIDPRMVQYRAEAELRGYHSSASIPLRCGDISIGAMRFYSTDIFFFNTKEIRLLEDLVADISFALEMMKKGNELYPLFPNRQSA